MALLDMPKKGMTREELVERLYSYKSEDAQWHDGHMFGLAYMADPEVEEAARAAYNAFMFENGLSPLAFPSLLRMETEFISMVTTLLGGDEETVGAMTSGGTESILMAVKAAREWSKKERPTPGTPELLAPITIHPAFNKAAHYLGLKIVQTPVRDDYRADVQAMEDAITENTVFIAGTAVTYPHGMVDPLEEIGALAKKHNLWMHVDACLGGYQLAFLRKAGYPIPPFDFSIPEIHSLSIDIHKYGYISKGASTVCYRNSDLRAMQYFVYTDWPGGVYATPSLSGGRPGGSIAAAWGIFHYLGEEGFVKLAVRSRKATEALMAGIEEIPGLYVLGKPDATVFAFGSDELNVFELAAQMKQAGWHTDAQHLPPSLHMTISPIHDQIVEPFLKDLRRLAGQVSKVKPEEISQDAAMYGMMGNLPDRQAAKEFALGYLNDLYKLKKD